MANIVLQVVNALWDIDNAISLGSIVFCFSNWKELLLPWPCFFKKFVFTKSSSTFKPTTDVTLG